MVHLPDVDDVGSCYLGVSSTTVVWGGLCRWNEFATIEATICNHSKKGTRFHVKTKLLICLETKQPNKQMGILQVLLPVLGVPAQDWSVSSCAMAGCSQWRSCRAAGEPLWQQHWAMVCKVLFFHLTTFGWVFWGQIYPQLAFGSLHRDNQMLATTGTVAKSQQQNGAD